MPRASFCAAACVLGLLAGGCSDPTLAPPVRRTFRLIEKGAQQSLYSADGRLERVLHDGNGDGTVDSVVLFSSDGHPRRAEMDTNGDQVVDRWEHYERGRLLGVSYDVDGDGRPDRAEAAR